MDNKDVIKELQEKVDSLKTWLKSPVLGEHIYVVGRDGLWLSSIDVHNGRLTGYHKVSSNAIDARTFSRTNADIIAKVTQNGNGFFNVQTKINAVKDCLHDTESALSMFELLETNML